MKRYLNYEEMKIDYPGTCEMIDMENEGQYPNAKFMKGVVGLPPNGDMELMALFDVGESDTLWVYCCGDIADPIPNRRSHIDEYYTVSSNVAEEYLTYLK